MQTNRINDIYLPDINLSEKLEVTVSLEQCCRNKELILFVSPSQVTRQVLTQALSFIDTKTIIASASKGIENDSLMLLSQVFEEILPQKMHAQLWFFVWTFICPRGQSQYANSRGCGS